MCPDEGSAMIIASAGVVLSGIQFIGCSTSAVEISAEGRRPIELENVTFLNNRAIDYFSTGGGLVITGCTSRCSKAHPVAVTLRNCRFEGNAAGVGGGISAESVRLTVSNCHFVNNEAKRTGGAIHITGALASLSVEDSVFEWNRVTSAGLNDEVYLKGGLPMEPLQYFRFRFPNANGGAVSVRSISTTSIVNCNFTENEAPAGGALSIESRWEFIPSTLKIEKSVQIKDSVFVGNSAVETEAAEEQTSSMGGAIYSVSTTQDFEWDVENCVFLGNTAFHGGAVHLATLLTTRPSISNSVFHGNEAESMGGAILLRNTGMLRLTACNLTENTGRIGGAIALTNNAMFMGRGLAGLPPLQRVGVPSLFQGNQAENGGAIACVGCGDMVLQDTVLSGNVASELGGGIYVFDTSASLQFLQNRFEDNRAKMGGGVALEAVARVQFTSAEESLTAVFSNNSAASGSAVHYIASHLKENRLIIARGEFQDNNATSRDNDTSAGGTIQLILNDIPTRAVADILLKDLHIHDNAAAFGGGVSVHVDGDWNDERAAACPASMLSTDPCRQLRFVGVVIEHNTADEAPGLFVTDSRALNISCDDEATWLSFDHILRQDAPCYSFNNNFITGTTSESNVAVSAGAL